MAGTKVIRIGRVKRMLEQMELAGKVWNDSLDLSKKLAKEQGLSERGVNQMTLFEQGKVVAINETINLVYQLFPELKEEKDNE